MSTGKKKIRYFVSHASADKEDVLKLLGFLEPLLKISKAFSFERWMDIEEILPGKNWRKEIDTAIEECDFGLLLVSPQFLASDFITTQELPELLKKKIMVPVQMHPVAFDGTMDLKGLEARQFYPKGSSFDACSDDAQRRRFAKDLHEKVVRLLENESGVSDLVGFSEDGKQPYSEQYTREFTEVADTEVGAQILRGTYWQIWIQPEEYRPARLKDLDHCRQMAQMLPIQLTHGKIPSVQSSSITTGNGPFGKFVLGEVDSKPPERTHLERWVIFQSGQFRDRVSLRVLPGVKGRCIHALEVLDLSTATLLIAARMSTAGLLTPRARISLSLSGSEVAGLALTWPMENLAGDPLADCWCEQNSLCLTALIPSGQLAEAKFDLALDLAKKVYRSFKWLDPPQEDLEEELRKRFRRQ